MIRPARQRLFLLFLLLALIRHAKLQSDNSNDLASRHQLSADIQHFADRFNAQSKELRPAHNTLHAGVLDASNNAPLELSELALVTTVDGAVHAIRRSNGQWAWTLHDNSAEREHFVSQPLVSSRTGPPAYPNYGSETSSSNVSAGTSINSRTAQPINDPLEDEIYVVEPAAEGAIYMHVKSTGKTQKLPLSMAELVERTPFTFPDDDSRMFVGKRTTTLVGVDLATGKLAGVFGAEAGWCEWHNRSPGMRDAESEEGIEHRPRDLLYLGRTGALPWKMR